MTQCTALKKTRRTSASVLCVVACRLKPLLLFQSERGHESSPYGVLV